MFEALVAKEHTCFSSTVFAAALLAPVNCVEDDPRPAPRAVGRGKLAVAVDATTDPTPAPRELAESPEAIAQAV